VGLTIVGRAGRAAVEFVQNQRVRTTRRLTSFSLASLVLALYTWDQLVPRWWPLTETPLAAEAALKALVKVAGR
jgi:hypothetical protein